MADLKPSQLIWLEFVLVLGFGEEPSPALRLPAEEIGFTLKVAEASI